MDKLKPQTAALQSDSDHLRFALQEAVGTVVASLTKKTDGTVGEGDLSGRDASKNFFP